VELLSSSLQARVTRCGFKGTDCRERGAANWQAPFVPWDEYDSLI
jgi:hypothetical protein